MKVRSSGRDELEPVVQLGHGHRDVGRDAEVGRYGHARVVEGSDEPGVIAAQVVEDLLTRHEHHPLAAAPLPVARHHRQRVDLHLTEDRERRVGFIREQSASRDAVNLHLAAQVESTGLIPTLLFRGIEGILPDLAVAARRHAPLAIGAVASRGLRPYAHEHVRRPPTRNLEHQAAAEGAFEDLGEKVLDLRHREVEACEHPHHFPEGRELGPGPHVGSDPERELQELLLPPAVDLDCHLMLAARIGDALAELEFRKDRLGAIDEPHAPLAPIRCLGQPFGHSLGHDQFDRIQGVLRQIHQLHFTHHATSVVCHPQAI